MGSTPARTRGPGAPDARRHAAPTPRQAARVPPRPSPAVRPLHHRTSPLDSRLPVDQSRTWSVKEPKDPKRALFGGRAVTCDALSRTPCRRGARRVLPRRCGRRAVAWLPVMLHRDAVGACARVAPARELRSRPQRRPRPIGGAMGRRGTHPAGLRRRALHVCRRQARTHSSLVPLRRRRCARRAPLPRAGMSPRPAASVTPAPSSPWPVSTSGGLGSRGRRGGKGAQRCGARPAAALVLTCLCRGWSARARTCRCVCCR